jgi:tetratricopeptide (TPR) repeat protein
VRELAEDVERYMAGRPIQARPSTFGYRAAKFVRRNRAVTIAGGLLFTVIVAGVGTTLWESRKAQRRFDQLRQLARFVMSDMNTVLQQLPGSTDLQRLSVERSLAYLDGLSAESGRDANLKLEVADGYRRLGDVLGNPFRPNLGERARAQDAYRKGLAALEGLPSTRESKRMAAELRLQLGGTRAFGGDAQAGLAEIRNAVEELKRLSSESQDETDLRLAVARGLDFLGTRVAAGGGEVETKGRAEAQAHFTEAIAQAQGVLQRSPGHPLALRQLAMSENNHGLMIGSTEPLQAEDHYRRAIAWLDQLPREEAAHMDARRLRATILMNAGWAEGQAGAYDNAIAHLMQAQDVLTGWLGIDPNNTNPMYQLTAVYRARGIIEGYRKNGEAAVKAFSAGAELHRQLSQRDPANTTYRYQRAEVLIRAGNWLVSLGRRGEAREQSAAGLQIMEELASSPKASLSHVFGGCRWFTETAVTELRKPVRAAEFCRQAMKMTNGEDPDAYAGLATALDQQGDRAGAALAIEKALTLIPPSPPGQPPSQQRREMEAELRRLRR